MSEQAPGTSNPSPPGRPRKGIFRSIAARRNLRLLTILLALVVVSGGSWAAYYAYDRGFTKRWRKTIIEELAKHGIVATIGKLTLDPVEGLVARDVCLYDDSGQERLLAKLSRISLDIDLAKLIQQEDFLSKVDFRNADLSLPLDPEEQAGAFLGIRDFSAQILMKDSRVEVTRAGGVISGVEFNVRGSLARDMPAADRKDGLPAKAAFAALKRRRAAAYHITQTMERFRFRGARPRVDLEINGNLDRIESLRVNAAFSGAQISHRDYIIQSVQGSAEVQQGEVALKHFILRDAEGELHLSGFHQLGETRLGFHLDSSASIHRLCRALSDRFRPDGVTFASAPSITAAGTFSWADYRGFPFEARDSAAAVPAAWKLPLPLPLDATGSVRCDAFSYHGERFGAAFDFSIDHDKFYLRNMLVENGSTGTLDGDVLITPEECHYEGRIRMDPTVLGQMLPDGAHREWLDRARFTDESSIQIELEGHRSATSGNTWEHRAEADMRDFEFDGRRIDRFECGNAAITGESIVLKDVRVEQAGGSAFEPRAIWTFANRKLTLTSLTSTLDPVVAAGIFSPELARQLAAYRFESPPNLQIKGTVSPGNIPACDLTAVLTSRGAARCAIGDRAFDFDGVAGNLQLKDGTVNLNLTAKSRPGSSISGLTFTEGASLAFAGRFPVAEAAALQQSYKVVVSGSPAASFQLAGVSFPLSNLMAELVGEGQRGRVDGSATLFGGAVAVTIDLPGIDLPGYKATVEARSLDFGALAAHLTPDSRTGGSLDALCSFSGAGDAGESIDGEGRIALSGGNLFALPVLGPLSPLVSRLYHELPGDYGVALEASAGFRIRGGKVTTDSFASITDAFTLSGAGSIDYLDGRVDLDASLQADPAAGTLVRPDAKLYRFSAGGKIAAPRWQWLDGDPTSAAPGRPATPSGSPSPPPR